MLYDIPRVQFLPLFTLEDVFAPKWNLRGFETEEHRNFMALNVFAGAGEFFGKYWSSGQWLCFSRRPAIFSQIVPYF